MKTTIATSVCGRFELLTNGNHQFWTRPTTGAFRSRYEEFAGRKLEVAVRSLEGRADRGY